VHKSQGSEFPAVIVALTAGNYFIMTRNLLYTAVTRAKNMVVIVGMKEVLSKMIKNNYTAKRFSLLKNFIVEEFDGNEDCVS
jgi:ATP-dependent exoDNAse (exonuclease V), alpha subunit - helicase superfamily I member